MEPRHGRDSLDCLGLRLGLVRVDFLPPQVDPDQAAGPVLLLGQGSLDGAAGPEPQRGLDSVAGLEMLE